MWLADKSTSQQSTTMWRPKAGGRRACMHVFMSFSIGACAYIYMPNYINNSIYKAEKQIAPQFFNENDVCRNKR